MGEQPTTRRARAVAAAVRAAVTGRTPVTRSESTDREALRRADKEHGATRGVRKPLRPV